MNAEPTEKNQKIAFFIDDDADFVTMIPNVVQHHRFEIRAYHATNGYQAIDEVIKTKPDVLFIDFGLPRASGGQILPILKSVQGLSELKIYFVTGYSTAEILPLVHGLKFHGIINKDENLKSEIIKVLDELDRSFAA
jgi:DNA-binding NarL/FixJ family response regulator